VNAIAEFIQPSVTEGPVVNRVMVIVAAMSATTMQLLDTTIVNVWRSRSA
jgi:hypothetical protein